MPFRPNKYGMDLLESRRINTTYSEKWIIAMCVPTNSIGRISAFSTCQDSRLILTTVLDFSLNITTPNEALFKSTFKEGACGYYDTASSLTAGTGACRQSYPRSVSGNPVSEDDQHPRVLLSDSPARW
jgi:hypothetical protein